MSVSEGLSCLQTFSADLPLWRSALLPAAFNQQLWKRETQRHRFCPCLLASWSLQWSIPFWSSPCRYFIAPYISVYAEQHLLWIIHCLLIWLRSLVIDTAAVPVFLTSIIKPRKQKHPGDFLKVMVLRKKQWVCFSPGLWRLWVSLFKVSIFIACFKGRRKWQLRSWCNPMPSGARVLSSIASTGVGSVQNEKFRNNWCLLLLTVIMGPMLNELNGLDVLIPLPFIFCLSVPEVLYFISDLNTSMIRHHLSQR